MFPPNSLLKQALFIVEFLEQGICFVIYDCLVFLNSLFFSFFDLLYNTFDSFYSTFSSRVEFSTYILYARQNSYFLTTHLRTNIISFSDFPSFSKSRSVHFLNLKCNNHSLFFISFIVIYVFLLCPLLGFEIFLFFENRLLSSITSVSVTTCLFRLFVNKNLDIPPVQPNYDFSCLLDIFLFYEYASELCQSSKYF